MHALSDLEPYQQIKFTWEVTKSDIDQGKQQDCWDCPVARSLNRVLPGLMADVQIGEIQLYYCDEDIANGRVAFEAMMPEIGNEFIMDYDGYGEDSVGPITLTATFIRLF